MSYTIQLSAKEPSLVSYTIQLSAKELSLLNRDIRETILLSAKVGAESNNQRDKRETAKQEEVTVVWGMKMRQDK